MAILLKRNATRDPWYTVHEFSIEEGDVVKLLAIKEDDRRCAEYPPEIYVQCVSTGDTYKYKASLCCFDYVGTV
jgi:hypothetical protein